MDLNIFQWQESMREMFIYFPGLLLPAPFTFQGLLDCDVNLNNIVGYPFYGF